MDFPFPLSIRKGGSNGQGVGSEEVKVIASRLNLLLMADDGGEKRLVHICIVLAAHVT